MKGARVDPYRRGFAGTQILLGVRSPGKGRWVLHGVRVCYRVGSQRFVARSGAKLVLCSPASVRCPLHLPSDPYRASR